MRAATLFSGIGAPEVAMPSWHWLWHAEIERFPSAVMATRHPSSVNLGDVTADAFTDRALAVGRPDVLVFGSPCQSFSVAGRRLGLDDPRGNLALVALGIVARTQPTWFVFENVPGLLSSADGRDFGLFLRTVDDLGYHVAWRVLDAQYFGVAQRRRRVFVVGHARDWRGPAAVLLEPDRLSGHPPTRRQAGQNLAPTLDGRAGRSGANQTATSGGLAIQDIAPTLRAGGNRTGGHRPPVSDIDTADSLIAGIPERERALTASNQRIDAETETLITHSLRAEGFDASEDGTGRGTPLVTAYQCQGSNVGEMGTLRAGNGNATGGVPFMAVSHALDSFSAGRATEDSTGLGCPIMPISYAIGSHAGAADADVSNRSHASGGPVGLNISEEAAYALRSGRTQAIAFSAKDHGADAGEIAPTLRSGNHTRSHANGGVMPAVAFNHQSGGDMRGIDLRPLAQLQRAQVSAVMASGVRRLTPRECERLQGLPDDYTRITYRGKTAADGPRYKAIGNSMAVPVVRWILERIALVDARQKRECAA